jgi:hypothetical protein
MAGSALAQNAPAPNAPVKAVRDLRDVQLDMPRDRVLAGLGETYDLTRIDDPKSDSAQAGDEYWMVSPKDDPKRRMERESGAIRFWQGKATSIEIDLYPPMNGESALFAERLFWLIYNRADSSTSPSKDAALDKLYKEVNARWATIPVQLQDRHDDKHEELKLFLTLGGQDFSISISKRPGHADSVSVEQNMCCAATD